MFDAIVVTDRIRLIKYANSTALEEFGYASADELVGNNVSVLVGAGGQAAHHYHCMAEFNTNEKTSTTIGKQRKLQAHRKDESEFECIIGIKEIPNTALLVCYIRITSGIANPERITNMSPSECNIDETSFDSIVVIEPRGKYLNANRTTLTEFGYLS